MTSDELAEQTIKQIRSVLPGKAFNLHMRNAMQVFIAAAIRDAAKEERERCEKSVEDVITELVDDLNYGDRVWGADGWDYNRHATQKMIDTANQIRDAIRARSREQEVLHE